jgi:hypothetical protein
MRDRLAEIKMYGLIVLGLSSMYLYALSLMY